MEPIYHQMVCTWGEFHTEGFVFSQAKWIARENAEKLIDHPAPEGYWYCTELNEMQPLFPTLFQNVTDKTLYSLIFITHLQPL